MGTMIPSVSTNSGGDATNQAIKSATRSGARTCVARASFGSLCWRSSGEKAPQLVAIAPGYTTIALMPCSLPSSASASVKPVRPNLEAQYAEALAQPFFPATEETLTIVPPPASRMNGKTALDSKNGALRFTESVRSQPSTSSSSTVPGVSVPAALTSTSMRPKASTARSTAPAASSSLARSMGKVNARRPVCETSSLVLSSSSSLLATSATSAPARARAIVVALPSPLLAPVTSATLPSRGRSPFTASLMLCHPPSDTMRTMGKEACHVCELAAISEVSGIADAFFCQRYCNYTVAKGWGPGTELGVGPFVSVAATRSRLPQVWLVSVYGILITGGFSSRLEKGKLWRP